MIKYIQKKSTKGWTLEKECKKLGIKKEDVIYCGKYTKWANMIDIDFYKNKTIKQRKIKKYLLYTNISSKEMITELIGKILMSEESEKDFNNQITHCYVLWDYVNEFTKKSYIIL